jgi:hypothetical protein
MKKLTIIAFCFFVTSFVFVGAGFFGIYVYLKKHPVDIEPWSEVAKIENKNWLSEAKVLASISALSVAAGADEWSVKLLTKAGEMLGTEQTLAAGEVRPLAKRYLQDAMRIAERLANETKDYGPLLRARLEYAKLMQKVGEKQLAITHLRDSMDMAKQFSSETKWIREFQAAIDAVSQSN